MRYVLDTNVLLRFLLGDHPELSPKARRLFAAASAGRCTLVLTEVLVAEAVWVLTSFYGVGRSAIVERLSGLIGKPGIRCLNEAAVLDALHRFGSTNLDYIDCHLAATAAAGGDGLATFDAKLAKHGDAEVWDPDV